MDGDVAEGVQDCECRTGVVDRLMSEETREGWVIVPACLWGRRLLLRRDPFEKENESVYWTKGVQGVGVE